MVVLLFLFRVESQKIHTLHIASPRFRLVAGCGIISAIPSRADCGIIAAPQSCTAAAGAVRIVSAPPPALRLRLTSDDGEAVAVRIYRGPSRRTSAIGRFRYDTEIQIRSRSNITLVQIQDDEARPPGRRTSHTQ